MVVWNALVFKIDKWIFGRDVFSMFDNLFDWSIFKEPVDEYIL